jgi:hypothetical protein
MRQRAAHFHKNNTHERNCVALAVAYQTVASVTTTAATVYTTSAATAASYGNARDLVVTNSGSGTIFVGLGTANVATSVASFKIPSGGTLLLTECVVPASAPLTAIAATGSSSTVSVGYASVVSVI